MTMLQVDVDLDLRVTPTLPARHEFRAQIAHLERRLTALLNELEPSRRPHPATDATASAPRMLDGDQLEAARNALVARIGEAEDLIARQASDRTAAVDLLKRMTEAPAEYRWAIVTTKDLGDPACRTWQSVPVLGPVGMFANWWRIRMSSGCP